MHRGGRVGHTVGVTATRDGLRLVWLLRHAKTLTDPPAGGGDHERTLAPRGRRDARALGARLGRGGDRLGLTKRDLPRTVLCSTAARTAQTAELVMAGVEPAPPVTLLRSLYQADPDDVVDQLRLVDDDVHSVMVVGHNPTASELAYLLLEPLKASQAVGRHGLATCALVVCGFPAERWKDLTPGTATWGRLFSPPY